MAITVRPARLEDAPEIKNILAMSFGEYQSLLGLPNPPSAMTETAEDIRDAMRDHVALLAVFNNMKAVGTIRLHMIEPRVGYVSRFGVLPNWQKSGAGQALMNAAVQWFREQGAKAVTLHTATKFISLARFYHSCGFYVYDVSTEKGYRRGLFVQELENCDDLDFAAICRNL